MTYHQACTGSEDAWWKASVTHRENEREPAREVKMKSEICLGGARTYSLSRPLFLTFIQAVLVKSPALPFFCLWSAMKALLPSVFVFCYAHLFLLLHLSLIWCFHLLSLARFSLAAAAHQKHLCLLLKNKQAFTVKWPFARCPDSIKVFQCEGLSLLVRSVWCDDEQGAKLHSCTHELIYPLSD